MFIFLANVVAIIIMTTMDIESFYAKILGINYPWIMPMHKFYFSFSSLKFILKKEKLKIDTYYHEKKITSLGYLLKKISIILFGRLFNKINFSSIPNIPQTKTQTNVRVS